jgi:hypothetical protein
VNKTYEGIMFTKHFGQYVCDGDRITCTVDGFTATATLYYDDCNDAPDERQEGFWPSHNPNDAGYVYPENFDAQQAIAEKVMAAWKNDEWHYYGVAVTLEKADIEFIGKYEHAVWGIEGNYPDSDNTHFLEVANDLLKEALDTAKAKIAKLCT